MESSCTVLFCCSLISVSYGVISFSKVFSLAWERTFYDYSITESKSTDSIYVKIHYGKSEICMRFSDHKGKSKNLKWFDYTAPKAKYGDMVRYIENRIKMVKYISLEKSLALIAA